MFGHKTRLERLEIIMAEHIKECSQNYRKLSDRAIWVLLAVIGSILFQIAVRKGLF